MTMIANSRSTLGGGPSKPESRTTLIDSLFHLSAYPMRVFFDFQCELALIEALVMAGLCN